MSLITVILGIITAIPKIIQIVAQIIAAIRALKKDPAYTVQDQALDESELALAVKAYKETHDVGPLRRLHERIRARRAARGL